MLVALDEVESDSDEEVAEERLEMAEEAVFDKEVVKVELFEVEEIVLDKDGDVVLAMITALNQSKSWCNITCETIAV